MSARVVALPHHLIYLLVKIYALEAALVIGGFHIVAAFHPGLVPVSTGSLAAFPGCGYPWLKTQREDLPFGFLFLATIRLASRLRFASCTGSGSGN